MLTHTRKDTITFDMDKMSSKRNNYDKSLPHAYNTDVVFQGPNGIITLSLGTLVSLAAIFDVMRMEGSPGPALDKLYNALRAEHGDEAVSQALKIGG